MNEAKSNTVRRLVRVCLRTKTSRKRAEAIRRVCGRVLACGPLTHTGRRWTFGMVNRPDIETAEIWMMLLVQDVIRIDYIASA